MLNRVLVWAGAGLTLLFAAWLVVDLIINGATSDRFATIALGAGTLAGLLLMWAAVSRRRRDSSGERSVSIKGDNQGIVSVGDNATNTQRRRDTT